MLERGLFMTIVVAGERKEYADGLTVEETVENMNNTLQGLLDEYIANNS